MYQFCKRGHLRVPENLYSDGSCKECKSLYSKSRYTSKPKEEKKFCRQGHLRTPDNVTKRGRCKACAALSRDKNLQYHRDYYKKHKEAACAKIREKYIADSDFRKRMLERTTRYNLALTGWTPEAIAEARIKQDDNCAICKKKFFKTPHSDHEHTIPPKRRELLCGACNKAIGMLKDSPIICEAAAAYLRK